MEIPYVVTPRKDTGLFNSKIAIWLFLASEVMLFGGFFSAYVFLRIGADYPWPERTLPVLPGLINTFILIASSVTVVFAWASLKMRQWGRFQFFMGITVACAAIFMVFKGIEYNVKFHHAAVRLNDYSYVEGHLGYEQKGGHGHDGHDHGEPEYLKDASGNKIEDNHFRIEATSVTFDLLRYHKPWLESYLAEAEKAGVKFTLAEDLDFSREGVNEIETFAAGSELSPALLEQLKQAQIHNRSHNSDWRTKFLRKAWDDKWAEVKATDGLGQGAFAAEYPAGLELGAEERKKAYKRWKAGKRSRLATEVNLEEAVLTKKGEDVTLADLSLPEHPTATFKVDGLLLRHTSHEVISKYDPKATSIVLRDGSVIGGTMKDSPATFHYVDGIDFQHLAMKAEEKGQDPLKAIENSWLIKENHEVAELWEKHQKAIGLLEEKLSEHDKEPTEKDRYRMGWQEIAYYMTTPLDEVALTAPNAAPKVKMTLVENFTGPDYKSRMADKENPQFPHIAIPREQLMLDSKFTPKWNTYYAIYFTITGLHGLHVIGGAIVLGYYLFFGRKMYLTNPEWLANRVEVGGLFWHFVDLVWIFAFPIFYLM